MGIHQKGHKMGQNVTCGPMSGFLLKKVHQNVASTYKNKSTKFERIRPLLFCLLYYHIDYFFTLTIADSLL